MVKIVKPKDGTMNMYTYYMRDAQGNIMATYTRNFSKVLDFTAITFTAANDTIKKYVGVSGLGNFASSIGANTGLINNYYSNLQNNQTFLKTFNPYTLLLNKAGALDAVLASFSQADLFKYYFGFNPSIQQLCTCLNNREANNSNYKGTLFSVMSTQAGFELILTKISQQGGPSGIQNVANSLGLDGSDYEHALSTLIDYAYPSSSLNAGRLTNVVNRLMEEYASLNSCDGMLVSILTEIYTTDENTFVAMMLAIPDINYLFNDPTDADGANCDLNLTQEQLASDLSMNRTSQTWAALLAWTTESDLINYYKTDEPVTFLSTAIKFQYTLLAPYQETHNLYGGAYGGLENYFVSMRSYFGQTLYDQLTEGFLKQSSTYKDSMNLTEWHMYGSSRLGIYQTKVNMAYRSVKVENGVTTQVSTTSISYASYSYFPTERGAKRYELTNHLGNVLVVISDKKIPICSNNLVTFYKADVVSATDYSAFGAPLSERTYQASEYRFGFNGKENDNEVNGDGGQQDYGMRVYDIRLGRFLSVDPLTAAFPWWSPYQFAGNMPIKYIDLDGTEPKEPDVPNSKQATRKINKYDRKLDRFAHKTGGNSSKQETINAFNKANANENWMYIYEKRKNSGEATNSESNSESNIETIWYSTSECSSIKKKPNDINNTPIFGATIQIGPVLNSSTPSASTGNSNTIPFSLPSSGVGNLIITNIGTTPVTVSADQNNSPSNPTASGTLSIIPSTNLRQGATAISVVPADMANGNVLHTTSSGNSSISIGFQRVIGNTVTRTPRFKTGMPIIGSPNFNRDGAAIRKYFGKLLNY